MSWVGGLPKEELAEEFLASVEEMYEDLQESCGCNPDFEEALERVKREGLVPTKEEGW